MKLVLDTHFLVWLAISPGRLKPAEEALIYGAGTVTIVSAVSLWELRIKWTIRDRGGRPKGPLDPASALHLAYGNGFAVTAPEPEDFTIPLDPPLPHRDPFDELLLVHAGRLGANLLTRDRAMRGHPLAISL